MSIVGKRFITLASMALILPVSQLLLQCENNSTVLWALQGSLAAGGQRTEDEKTLLSPQ